MVTKNDIINFGKYKDEYIQTIMTIDPSYINWCLINIKDFNMPIEDKIAVRHNMSYISKSNYQNDCPVENYQDYCLGERNG